MIETLRSRVRLVQRVLERPHKFFYMLRTRSGLHALRYLIAPPRHGAFDQTAGGISARRYGSYEEYVRHQRSKLALVDLREYDRTFRADLAQRLQSQGWAGKAVLCLAARIGTEVRAFHDVGAFAVGIDLEPGKDNHWVLPGDFHQLVFPDDCVDGLYCNSLDHALELGRLLVEVKRVLKPGGIFLVDAQHRSDERDDWGATGWKSVDDLVGAIVDGGFELKARAPIRVPQPGEQLHFTPVSRTAGRSQS
jgi:SAM-dependent methyltransferase